MPPRSFDARSSGFAAKEAPPAKGVRILRDLVLVLSLAAVVFTASYFARLFDLITRLAKGHPKWFIGEISVVLLVLAIPLLIISLMRSIEIRREVSSRKKIEEKLLQKTSELDSIFKAFPDLYFRLDSDGTVLDFQAGRQSDLSPHAESLLGKRIQTVLPSDVSKQFHEALIQVSKKNAPVSIEYSLSSRGSTQSFEARFLPFQRKQVMLIFRDITERKKAEEALQLYAEELRHSNEELKIFAYIVSHDLRAPLVNIKGFTGELKLSLKEIDAMLASYLSSIPEEDREKLAVLIEKDVPEALSFISSSVSRMDNLTNAILKLSRLGRRDLKFEQIDMQALAQHIVRSLAHQIERQGVSVEVGELPSVIADTTSMEQIIGNLVDNAIKYLEPGRPGQIEITADSTPAETVFSVRDNGRGIGKEDIEKVFEIFRRAGKPDVPGEGMGLSYVKTLVRRHGGRIWCQSVLGEGTTFYFSIPAKAREHRLEAAA